MIRGLFLTLILAGGGIARAVEPSSQPTGRPAGVAHFPHVTVDMKEREVRVECESLNPQMPLEFFCCLTGTNEHESVLRTKARPSHIHTGLLMLGAAPGSPARYDEGRKKWLPPHGAALELSLEVTREGKTVREPARLWVRELKTKRPPERLPFVFAGSKVMPDGTYAADATGYVASIVNFDYTLIDVPRVASSSNETLEYEYNPDTVPKTGTPVTLVIRLAAGPATRPTVR